jgi:DedD protein
LHTIASSEDTEITLGVGKLLGLFFLLAAICGVFFSIGYSLGRSAGREQAMNDQPQVSAASDAAPASSGSAEGKPSAAVGKPQQQDVPASGSTAPQQSLTFYKAVQQSGPEVDPATTKPKTADSVAEKDVAVSEMAAKAPALANASAVSPSASNPDVISHTSPVTGPGTIVVQIAALSREDDAVSLAGALRKKNYNVFVVNNPVNNDKFYHVQVGPFSNLADAQAMKAKLVAEGYNPIIKK